MTTKRCVTCGTAKSLAEFGVDRHLPDQHRNVCKACSNAQLRSRRRMAHYEVSITSKRCPACRSVKAASEFHPRATQSGGLATYCKACNAMKHSEWRLATAYGDRASAMHKEERDRALAHYGNRCACCGENRREFLAFDHINDDGAAHRRADTGARMTARWLVRHGFPSGFQVLCHNCNTAKNLYGACPHRQSISPAPVDTQNDTNRREVIP